MINLMRLVPSLEVCQQLKAAGFPQDTGLKWEMQHEPHIPDVQPMWIHTAFNEPILCAAPTAEEILTKLPSCIERGGVSYYLEVQITPAWGWDVDWSDDDGTYLQPRGEEDCKQSIVVPAALAYLWWKAQT